MGRSLLVSLKNPVDAYSPGSACNAYPGMTRPTVNGALMLHEVRKSKYGMYFADGWVILPLSYMDNRPSAVFTLSNSKVTPNCPVI